MKLLSIIIPVYNTNIATLQSCFASIRVSVESYEVIIVDDGSRKEVELFCINYASKYPDIFSYYKKINGGVSSARNMGIEKASGKYIMFVDSDDVLYGKEIMSEDFNSNADLIFYNKTLIKGKNTKIRKEIEKPSGQIDCQTIIEEMIKKNRFHGPMSRLYKKEFLDIHYIRFNERMIQAEDAVFNINVLKHNPDVYYWDRSVYGYNLSNTSIRGRWKKNSKLMFENFRTLYQTKLQLIDGVEEKKKRELTGYLITNTESILFQSCMDMMQIGCLDELMKALCYEFSLILSYHNIFCTSKAEIASILINNRMWGIIKVIAVLRDFYLTKLKITWN